MTNLSGFFFFDLVEYFNFYWYSSSWLSISLSFLFDELALTMFFLVTSVSLCVHFYSIEYMSHDPERNIFLGYLSLFTFFMLVLVSSGNLIQFFIGWEGIGLCSYLLINYWHMRIEANKASIKAVVVNKIGDCSFLLALGLVYYYFKTFSIPVILSIVPETQFVNISVDFFPFDANLYTLMLLFFLFAVMGKSAQIGLHTWLPDAMEGPTPVSALIHAATMVTAGIFLVIRLADLFLSSGLILNLIILIGALTAFLAGGIACFQTDLKKAIAYSTCSQLGYMLVSCGYGNFGIALFHLFTHGFFKALLFLCAGSILHGFGDNQNIYRHSSLYNLLNSYLLKIGAFALAAFPGFSGFFSKELILSSSLISPIPGVSIFGYFIFFLLTIGAVFTWGYTNNMFVQIIIFDTIELKKHAAAYHPPAFFMTFAVICLSIPSFFSGFLFEEYFISLNNDFSRGNWVIDEPLNYTLLWFFGIFFLSADFVLTKQTYGFNFRFGAFDTYFSRKGYFDKLYNVTILQPLLKFASVVYRTLDMYLFIVFGPRGLVSLLTFTAKKFSKLQNGFLFSYFIIIIFGVFFIFFLCYT